MSIRALDRYRVGRLTVTMCTMSPWFEMPTETAAVREAAVADVRAALAAIRCAIQLLEATTPLGRERELLSCITEELRRVRRAVHMLSRR